MEVKIPQQIESEDKLIGPLTLRQFLKLAIMFGILYLLYSYLVVHLKLKLSFFIFGLIALPITIFFLLLTFYKVNEQPFEKFLLAALAYYTQPQKRVWGKIPSVPKKIIVKKKEPPPRPIKKVTRSKIEELAYILDTRGHIEEIGAAEKSEIESVVEEMKKELVEKRSGGEITTYKSIEDFLPPQVIIPKSIETKAQKEAVPPEEITAPPPVPPSPLPPKPPGPKKEEPGPQKEALPKSPPYAKIKLPKEPEKIPPSPTAREAKIAKEVLAVEREKEKPQIIIEAPTKKAQKPFIQRIIITMQDHIKELRER